MSKDSNVSQKVFSEIQASETDPPAREAADGAGDELGLDTAPSNTVSNKYNNTEYFQPLRFGIDSLYVSFAGELHADLQHSLDQLKKYAQSEDLYEQSRAQLQINDHLFEVKDKGTGMFPYVLDDNCFRIQLSRNSAKSMPMAYIKISSEYLTHKTVLDVMTDLNSVLEKLGSVQSQAKVSRVDLFVDFASNENMDSWHRDAWVTRSEKINQYSVRGHFSGWSIGMGSGMAARLYNKLFEIESSQKAYLIPLWQQAGWSGLNPVWRLEFEIKRDVLVQFYVQELSATLTNLNGLWSYATTEWLKLTIPNESDTNRLRWPIHPLWGFLSSIDFESTGGALSREFSPQRIPSLKRLFIHGFSALSSFMAIEGIVDYEQGIRAYSKALEGHLSKQASFKDLTFEEYVEDHVTVKGKRFNTITNKAIQAYEDLKEAYRKASDGE